MGASIKVGLSVVDAAQKKSTRARSAENSEPKPPAQQSQTHSGGSRDRPATAWPYYYDRKQ